LRTRGRILLLRRRGRVLRLLRRWRSVLLSGILRRRGRVLRLLRRGLLGRGWPSCRDRYRGSIASRGLLPWRSPQIGCDLHRWRRARSRKGRRFLRLFGAERAVSFRGGNVASALRTYPAEHWLFPLYTSRHTRAVTSHSNPNVLQRYYWHWSFSIAPPGTSNGKHRAGSRCFPERGILPRSRTSI
jgi:hypothetical protein